MRRLSFLSCEHARRRESDFSRREAWRSPSRTGGFRASANVGTKMVDEQSFSLNEVSEAALTAIVKVLFLDRRDVYAVQIKTQDGCIYQPVRQTLDDKVILRHLRGEITIGIYPGMERTRWLAVDIDSKDPSRVRAVVEAMQQYGIEPAVLDSGKKGFHVICFFSQPIANWKARQIGSAVSCGNEAFPKQDRVEDGKKLGNLIKLGLGVHQETGRRCLFVNKDLVPYPDQVAFLQSVKRHDGEALSEQLPEDKRRPHERTRNTSPALTVRVLKPCVKALLASGTEQGKRNQAACIVATEARRLGMSFKEALVMLKVWNLRNKPPLSGHELVNVLRSVFSGEYEYGCAPDSPLRSVVECLGVNNCEYYRRFVEQRRESSPDEAAGASPAATASQGGNSGDKA